MPNCHAHVERIEPFYGPRPMWRWYCDCGARGEMAKYTWANAIKCAIKHVAWMRNLGVAQKLRAC